VRVLLVNSNLKDDFLAAPPIGLCYVARTAAASGRDVRVVDLCFQRRVDGVLEHAIREFAPDVVGVSIRNIDNANMLRPVAYLSEAQRVVQRIRTLTAAPIVLGGSGASLNPAGVLRFLGADHIVVSEGERAFVDLLDRIESGAAAEGIPGVGTMSGGEFDLTPPVAGEFPAGSTDLGSWIDMRPYQRMGSSYTIQTKRGCLKQCIYCTYGRLIEGNTIRLRSPKDVVDEVEEALRHYKPETFEFVDSVFNEPREHSLAIFEEIVRRPWKAHFTAMGVSPRGLDREFLNLMWRAGFTSFMITPESASPAMIENYRKGFDPDDVIHAAEALANTRFTTMWYFLIGGPGETNATLQETLDFVEKHLCRNSRPPYDMANFFLGVRVYPGTPMWDIAAEQGFVSPQTDPLRQVWYISEELDLDRAVGRMTAAAAMHPEVSLGFDEAYVKLSSAISLIGRLFRLPKPYWRHTWGANRLLMKGGLRFILRPPDVVPRLRTLLAEQGYRGSLVKSRL